MTTSFEKSMLSEKKSESIRKEWVDCAKGVAVLLVVFAHVINSYIIMAADTYSEGWAVEIMRFSYATALHSFFFLSGIFAIKLNDRKIADVLLSKARLIYYPYVVWALIHGIIKIYTAKNITTKVSWNDLLYVFIQPVGVTWFLFVLFWSYILFRLLSGKLHAVAILLVGVILYFFTFFTDVLTIKRFCMYFVYFVLGATLSRWILSDYAFKYFNTLIALPVSLIAYNYAPILINYHMAKVLFSLSSIYLLISVSFTLEKYNVSNIVKYFSYVSLMIYLLHMVPLTVYKLVLFNYFHVRDIYLYVACQMVLTILSCLLFIKFAEKIKISNYLFGR